MTHKILVPLDEPAAADTIMPEVERLAHGDATVHFLHVVPPYDSGTGGDPLGGMVLERMALDFLGEVRERFPMFRGLQMVRMGPTAAEILRAAMEFNIDLIALGRPPCTEGWTLRAGGVAEEIVRESRLPVLLGPREAPEIHRLRRILVPLDGSRHSAAILEEARRVALRAGAEVVILHVVEKVRDPAPQWAFKGPISYGNDPIHSFQAVADDLEDAGLNSWSVVAEGDPVGEILRQADLLDADLIAMSTHARSGLERTFSGSVAHGVACRADRPILLQRPTLRPRPLAEGERHDG